MKKIRNRVAALVTGVIVACGLSVVTFAPAASAYPAEGTWKVDRSCVNQAASFKPTPFNGEITAGYEVHKTGVVSGAFTQYQFTLTSALYTGDLYPSNNNPWPTIKFSANQGTLVSAANKGAVTSQNSPWARSGTAVGPVSARVGGIAPADWWVPILFSTNGVDPEPSIYISFQQIGNNSCQFKIPLNLPQRPADEQYMELNCNNGEFQATVDFETTKDPSTGIYTTEVTDFSTQNNEVDDVNRFRYLNLSMFVQSEGILDFVNDPNPVAGDTGYLDLGDTASGNTINWDLELLEPFHPVEWQWVEGVDRPDISLRVSENKDQGSSFPEGQWCTKNYRMGVEYDDDPLTQTSTYTNNTSRLFDDCQGGFGTVSVESVWHTDANGEFVQPVSVKVTNSSQNRIYLPTGSPPIAPNAIFRTDFDGAGTDQVFNTQIGNSSDANHLWLPGESKFLDIKSENKWQRTAIGPPYRAPGNNNYSIPGFPVFDMTFKSTQLFGGSWIPCGNSDPDLAHIEAKSLHL